MEETRVLHVVATTQRRGGEVFAADLIHALNKSGVTQQVAILHSSSNQSVDFGVSSQELGGGNLARISRLRRLIRAWRPQVIQAHGGEAMKVAVLAFVDVPIVYRRIGSAPASLRNGWRRLLYQRLIGRSARVVAVAEAVRWESITLLKIPPNRIVTIPNGVDAERLIVSAHPSVRQDLGIPDCAPVFLSVGALTWEKDPLALMRVAAEVLRHLPDAVYVVLGDGPMRQQVEGQVSALGLVDRVRMLGTRSDVADILASADAVLFASRPDGMEGMPASLIEAGMLATPSIAYDVAGVGDVVVDGLTGVLVPWGDEAALSGAMLEVLKDPAARATMGDAARQRCVAEFSIERVAPQYLRLYQEVLAG